MPSHPLSPILAMNCRRFGVSTIWAMFSRVRSKTSGSSWSSRKRSTSAANSRCSGVKSKSMQAPGVGRRPKSDGATDYAEALRRRFGTVAVPKRRQKRRERSGDDAVFPQLGERVVVDAELGVQHLVGVLADPGHAGLGPFGHVRQLHRV